MIVVITTGSAWVELKSFAISAPLVVALAFAGAAALGGARWRRLEAIVVDLSAPGDPVRVVKVIVPGLEAEVLSHHRIGPRGIGRLRARLPHTWHSGEHRPDDGWSAVPGGWMDVRTLEALTAPFLPLYREPGRHAYTAP